MKKEKTVYIADDGTEFDFEFEMKFRDQELRDEREVNKWLDSLGLPQATRTRSHKAILDYLRHTYSNGSED